MKEQLLDKNENPITKDAIEKAFKELYKDEEPWIQKCEWEEDGKLYHTYKIKGARGYIYTNDAGVEQLNNAIKEEMENYAKEINKGTKEDQQ